MVAQVIMSVAVSVPLLDLQCLHCVTAACPPSPVTTGLCHLGRARGTRVFQSEVRDIPTARIFGCEEVSEKEVVILSGSSSVG